MTVRKVYGAAATELGPRRVRVQCSSGAVDRTGEIVVQAGVTYAASLPVLWNHDPAMPIGRAYPARDTAGNLIAEVEFAPAGVSAKADEICGLVKAGVIDTVSIGFDPIDMEPMSPGKPKGPQRYLSAEWLELSFVSVPANPDAQVTERTLRAKGDGAEWKVGASTSLPTSAEDCDSWDGPAAAKTMLDAAGFDGDDADSVKARKGFLAYDAANRDLRGAYILPFATMKNGRLTVTLGGVKAAAALLPHLDIPIDVQAKARKVLDHYEEKLGMGNDDGARAAQVTKVKAAVLSKGMWQVGQLANLLADLGWQQEGAEWESAAEGDNSKVPGMLADALRVLADAFLAMAEEEVRELLGEEEGDVGLVDVSPADAGYVLAGKTPAARKFRAAMVKARTEKSGRSISKATEAAITEAIGHHDQAMKSFKSAQAAHETALVCSEMAMKAHKRGMKCCKAAAEPGVKEPGAAASSEVPGVQDPGPTDDTTPADHTGKVKEALAHHQAGLEHQQNANDGHEAALDAHQDGLRAHRKCLKCLKAILDHSDEFDDEAGIAAQSDTTDGTGKSYSRRQREADVLALTQV